MPTRRPALICALIALASWGVPAAQAAPASSLAAYRSEGEFQRALTRWRDAALKLQGTARRAQFGEPSTATAPAAASCVD